MLKLGNYFRLKELKIMTKTELEINVKMQIQKPIHDVFEAVVNPDKMSNYFIAWGSDTMETDKTIEWKFPEFDEKFPIKTDRIIPNKLISFYWEMDDLSLLVEITLDEINSTETLVTITEGKRIADEAGLQWLSGNSFGWSNFLTCLKAYLEYGINLRKGAFEYMKS
jgi:uncharacterized protein YndB with AHSA1/START domain